jgi:hypothetical protein
MSYRSNAIDPTAGVEVLPDPTFPGRNRNIVRDVLTLPLVVALPRKSVETLGVRLPLHYEFRRWTWRTERCVEIALGKYALSRVSPDDVLEVGNVLPLAGITGHTVVDKYERGPGVLNLDIVEYDPGRRFKLAVSISTLEHVGWDEEPRDPAKAAAALGRVGELADHLLVTIPVGVHREFERAFLDGPFDDVELLVKTSRQARWTRRPLAEREHIRYSAPYANANGILVGSRGLAGGNPA